MLTIVAFAVAPNAPRDLAHEAFIDPLVVARHAYLIVYAFALILCAVAEYFVSAKRFADRGKPPALAGLAPFSLLIAGAAYWYQPRSEGTMPEGLVSVFDALAVAILAWNVIELGFGASRRRVAGSPSRHAACGHQRPSNDHDVTRAMAGTSPAMTAEGTVVAHKR